MNDRSEPYLSQLEAVDTKTLTPMVRELLDDPALNVTNWTYKPILGGFGGAAGPSLIYRFSGQCKSDDEPKTWSLILKIILARDEAPTDPKYWKREYEVYRSSLLDDLPAGISAPRGYGVTEYPDESVWVWMAEVCNDREQPATELWYTHVAGCKQKLSGNMWQRAV